MYQLICCILSILPKAKYVAYMQHHILCNISYVVIAESMRKSLKCTIIIIVQLHVITN